MTITGNETGFMYGNILRWDIYALFDQKMYVEGEYDRDFDWIITGNSVILPEQLTVFRCGAAGTCEGTYSSYSYEFEILHTYDENIENIIAEKADMVNSKKYNKREKSDLISAIWGVATDYSEESLEYLKDFQCK